MKVQEIKHECLSLILSLGLSFCAAGVDRRLCRCAATPVHFINGQDCPMAGDGNSLIKIVEVQNDMFT